MPYLDQGTQANCVCWISTESIVDVVGFFDAGDYQWVIERPIWKVAVVDVTDVEFDQF